MQLFASVNKSIVRGLSSLDHRLEELGVLPAIDKAPVPEEVMDSDGNLASDCSDVRATLA